MAYPTEEERFEIIKDATLERFNEGTEQHSSRTLKFNLRFIGTFNRNEEEIALVEEGKMFTHAELPGLTGVSIMVGEEDDSPYLCIYGKWTFDVYFINTVTPIVPLYDRIKKAIGGFFNDRTVKQTA